MFLFLPQGRIPKNLIRPVLKHDRFVGAVEFSTMSGLFSYRLCSFCISIEHGRFFQKGGGIQQFRGAKTAGEGIARRGQKLAFVPSNSPFPWLLLWAPFLGEQERCEKISSILFLLLRIKNHQYRFFLSFLSPRKESPPSASLLALQLLRGKHDGYRSVVHDPDLHIGAELAGLGGTPRHLP